MYRAGTIDKAMMRSFDLSCRVAPPPLKPREIKKLRERCKVEAVWNNAEDDAL